jgi:hypothetical protein
LTSSAIIDLEWLLDDYFKSLMATVTAVGGFDKN